MLWAKRLAAVLCGGGERGSARHALAEAVAVTVSATVATAPLMAAAFDQFSPAALPANVLAAPAVAPAMWLGHAHRDRSARLPLLPVEPINWLDSLCLAYIAQVAHWLAAPRLGAPDRAPRLRLVGGGSVRRALGGDGAAPAPGSRRRRGDAGSRRPALGGLAAVAARPVAVCWRAGRSARPPGAPPRGRI